MKAPSKGSGVLPPLPNISDIILTEKEEIP